MKTTTYKETSNIIEFTKKAAEKFKKNPELATATNSKIKGGCLLAIRWGLFNDGILIVKLDDEFEPVLFKNVIPRGKDEKI